MSRERILERILRESGLPGLLETLAEGLEPTDLQSLLLEVYRRRVAGLTPRRVLERHGTNRFVRPSRADPRMLLAFDRLAFALLPPGHEPVELSPLAPLGAVSALAPLDQDLAVSTSRNTEVCSDPTNVLALECVGRRRAERRSPDLDAAPFGLAASHRVVRPQVFDQPHAFPHFRLFALGTAGRAGRDLRFEVAACLAHADFYLRLLARVGEIGLEAGRVRLRLLVRDRSAAGRFEAGVLAPLRRALGTVESAVETMPPEAGGYYTAVRLQVLAQPAGRGEFPLADGGSTDWATRLHSDRREGFFASAIGSERLVLAAGP